MKFAAISAICSLAIPGVRVLAADAPAGPANPIRLPCGIELVPIPPGGVELGSEPDERTWAIGPEGKGEERLVANEGFHRLKATVAMPYWLGRTEVTIGQWKAFVKATGYITDAEALGMAWSFDWAKGRLGAMAGASWRQPGYAEPTRDEDPVACVSWNDAEAFVAWLNRMQPLNQMPEGFQFRLPTEAEWERACRAGRQGTRFWWGDDPMEAKGRLNAIGTDKLGGTAPPEAASTEGFDWADGYLWAAPVGSFGDRGRNAFGLADMLGNVWEWCLDGYDAKGPHGITYLADTAERVVRGGSFMSGPFSVRCASRNHLKPAYSRFDCGFRVCAGSAIEPYLEPDQRSINAALADSERMGADLPPTDFKVTTPEFPLHIDAGAFGNPMPETAKPEPKDTPAPKP